MNESNVEDLEERITKAWFQIGLKTFLWFSFVNALFFSVSIISLYEMHRIYQESVSINTDQKKMQNILIDMEKDFKREAYQLESYRKRIFDYNRQIIAWQENINTYKIYVVIDYFYNRILYRYKNG